MKKIIEVHVSCGAEQQVQTFTKFPVNSGRDKRRDLVLNYAIVSRRHFRIERVEGSNFIVVDDGSTNGIFYRGKKMLEPLHLVDGDVFSISNVEHASGNVVPTVVDIKVVFKDAPSVGNDADTEVKATKLYSDSPEESARAELAVRSVKEAQARAVRQYADSPEVVARGDLVAGLVRDAHVEKVKALQALGGLLEEATEEYRTALVWQLVSDCPELAEEQRFRELVSPHIELPPPPVQSGVRMPQEPSEDAVVALREIQRIWTLYVPDPGPLEGPDNVAAFCNRIEKYLSANMMARAMLENTCLGHHATAPTPLRQQLGHRLLDIREPEEVGAVDLWRPYDTIAAAYKKMAGALDIVLEALSPANIERAFPTSRWFGAWILPWKLLRELGRRHSDLVQRFGRRPRAPAPRLPRAVMDNKTEEDGPPILVEMSDIIEDRGRPASAA